MNQFCVPAPDGPIVIDLLPEQVRTWLAEKHARVLASQLVEDGFCRQRFAEKAGRSTTLSLDHMWSTLVDRRILGDVHGFREVDWRAQPAQRDSKIPAKALECSHRTNRRRGTILVPGPRPSA